MPGQVRAGPQVDAASLARRFPGQDERHLRGAARVIGSVPLRDLDWNAAQRLGLAEQHRYGELVQELLDAAAADVVRRAPAQLSRLLLLLESCAEDFDPRPGWVGQWLRKDRPRQTGRHRPEIDQLRGALTQRMHELAAPMERVIQVRSRLQALFDDLMAHGIACEWLSLRDGIDELVRDALAERAQALVKTAGLVQAQRAQSMAAAQQLDALRDRIQDAVLIALPSWLAQLAALPADLNDTQRFVVRDDLRLIIDRLKH